MRVTSAARIPVGHSAGTNRYPRAIYSNQPRISDLAETRTGPVVVARVSIPLLVCRRGGDGLGGRRDRRLDRGLNVCLGVGDGAGINGDGARSSSVSEVAPPPNRAFRGEPPPPPELAAELVVVVVVVSWSLRGRRRAVRTARHRQHSRRDGGDADCQRRAFADARDGERTTESRFPRKVTTVTARFIPTCTRASGNRTAGGSLRRACCQPAELTGSIGRFRSAAGASAGTTGCSCGIGSSRLYGWPWAGRWST